MKPAVKKVLIVSTLLIAGFGMIAYEKVNRLKAIFDLMTIKPHGLPKNVGMLPFTQIYFDIDIILTNPTTEDFSASGYVVTVTEIAVFFRGRFIGHAKVDINEIDVPHKDTLILKNVHVVVATEALLENIMTLTQQLESMDSIDMDDLQFTAILEVLGNYYEIG